MQVYSMKNILQDVINKTLAYINSFFKKYNTLFTKPVKKIIYPDEIEGKENNPCSQTQHRAAVGRNIDQKERLRGLTTFTRSKYNYFSMLNVPQKI